MNYDRAQIVEERIDRVLTQYRESPNLLFLLRTYLDAAAEVGERQHAIAEAFNIETSTGDQLTMIGKWLGWPRIHCNGRRIKAFGYGCGNCRTSYPVGGYCEGVRYVDPKALYEEHTFSDDEVYRRWLVARGSQITIERSSSWNFEALEQAATALFDHQVLIVRNLNGSITLCITRYVTEEERATLHLTQEVLPVPPGVKLIWAHCNGVPFGYGEGWNEYCVSEYYSIIRDPFERDPKSELFGYGPDYSGYCEGVYGPGGEDQEL